MTREEWDAYAEAFGEDAATRDLGPRPQMIGDEGLPDGAQRLSKTMARWKDPSTGKYMYFRFSPKADYDEEGNAIPAGWQPTGSLPQPTEHQPTQSRRDVVTQLIDGQKHQVLIDLENGNVIKDLGPSGTEKAFVDFVTNKRTGFAYGVTPDGQRVRIPEWDEEPQKDASRGLVVNKRTGYAFEQMADGTLRRVQALDENPERDSARTTIIHAGGRQVLINAETGATIKDLGPAEEDASAPQVSRAPNGNAYRWDAKSKSYQLVPELSGRDDSQERLTREGWQRDDQRFQWQMQRDEQRLAEEAKQRERDRLLRMRELEYQNRFADVHGSRRESIDNLYGHLAGGSGVGASDNPFYGLFGMNAIREFQGQKDTMATAAQNVLGRQAAQAMGPAQADEQKRLQWEAEQKRWEQEASRPRAPLSAFGGPFGGGQNFRPSPFVDSGRAPARPQLPGGFWDPRRLPQLPGLAHGGMVVGNGEPVTISAGGEPMAVAGEAGPEMLNFPRQDMATVTPMGPSQQQMDMMGAALFIKNLLGASRAQKGRPFR